MGIFAKEDAVDEMESRIYFFDFFIIDKDL